MIPLLCVILFSILGTWILIDPLPGYLLLNFPEVVGRILIGIWFWVVTTPAIFKFHMKIIPVTTILYYADLIDEITLMAKTPLGQEPKDKEDE